MRQNTLKIHLEVLDKKRQELLEKLLPYTEGFILGGGTALVLKLAHRKSVDFDLFSQSPISKNLAEKVSQTISIANISVDTSDELTFFTNDEIKVSFIHYPFGHAFALEELDNGLQLFSVKDIAIKKAYTIGRRGEYRDYFDLYTILKDGYMNLSEVVFETKKIYGSVFEEKIFLQQLVYFGDLLNFDLIPENSTPLPKPKDVKDFFEKLTKDYIAQKT